MVFRVRTVKFWSLQATILPDTMPWRISHGWHRRRFCTMAFASGDCRRSTDRRATRLVAGGVCLPAPLRRGLLFQPAAQSFPAALRVWTQGRTDRSLGRRQPAHSLAAARNLFQRGGASSAPPHGRSAPRQTAAALCRPHRRVHPDPCRRQPLRPPRLHPAHLGRACFHRGLAPLLQEVWSRSRHACRGHGSQPSTSHTPAEPRRVETAPASQPVPPPPPPFSRRGRSTRGRSC